MRRNRIVIALVACLAASACAVPVASSPGGDSAACAGPYVETAPRQAQPGTLLTVQGDYYLDACHDTGEPRKAEALRDLTVSFAQDGELTQMGQVDASEPSGAIRTTITVPPDARPGLAEVTVGSAHPALVMVGDGRGGFPPWPGPPTGPFPLTVDLQAMPSFPEGGWVLASATTVDFQVPDADKRVTAVEPLGADEVSFGDLFPTYWMVDVRVHRCERLGCPPPTETDDGPTCEMEVRVLDGPARMIYTYEAAGSGRCDLRGTD